jgi:hypothetical protein
MEEVGIVIDFVDDKGNIVPQYVDDNGDILYEYTMLDEENTESETLERIRARLDLTNKLVFFKIFFDEKKNISSKKHYFFYPVILKNDDEFKKVESSIKLAINVRDCKVFGYITHPDWAEVVNVNWFDLASCMGKNGEGDPLHPFQEYPPETQLNKHSRIEHVLSCLIKNYHGVENKPTPANKEINKKELRNLILPHIQQLYPNKDIDYNKLPKILESSTEESPWKTQKRSKRNCLKTRFYIQLN